MLCAPRDSAGEHLLKLPCDGQLYQQAAAPASAATACTVGRRAQGAGAARAPRDVLTPSAVAAVGPGRGKVHTMEVAKYTAPALHDSISRLTASRLTACCALPGQAPNPTSAILKIRATWRVFLGFDVKRRRSCLHPDSEIGPPPGPRVVDDRWLRDSVGSSGYSSCSRSRCVTAGFESWCNGRASTAVGDTR